ncbi:MAG: tRNA threonylcarbamoyladenosine dehydratase [Tissierellia bacterium]|nr:tRNA threonylcarbamoyladenosine dehydratase [Tissierellia bacterium]
MQTENKFTRTEKLIGKEALEILGNSKVLLFGLGGVGGYVAEALVRSNIPCLTVVDYDTISVSNINRQIIALESTIGKTKVDVIRQRLSDINSHCHIHTERKKVNSENISNFHFEDYDYIVDAIDDIGAKVAIVKEAKAKDVPIISAMGAGNQLDPLAFKVSDIYKTSHCPLARAMRKRLRKENIRELKVVFSDIEPVVTSPDAPSSIAFVPPVMGLIIGAEVVKDLIRRCEV